MGWRGAGGKQGEGGGGGKREGVWAERGRARGKRGTPTTTDAA